MTLADPIVWAAFLAGVVFGVLLDPTLHLIVDIRFRVSRLVARRHRAVHGGR